MTGFTFEGDVYVDIDECATGAHVCQPSAVCVNKHMGTDGQKYSCDCEEGTMPDILYNRHELARTAGVIITCKDINECEIGADRCHIQAHCLDTAYDHSDGCDMDSDVDCTPGYDCECNTGYEADPNGSHADSRDKGPVCVDIDECTVGTHNCNEHAKCHNNEGSFTCSCKKGWTGTAYGPGSCTDYDECANGLQAISSFARGRGKKNQRLENSADPSGVCPNWSSCTNLSMLDDVEENGYQCVCSAGYTASATDPETNIVTECSDIDECADETDSCDANATCSNNAGGYDCTCNAGYSQSGLGHTGECHNIDECTVPSHNCDENATCGDTIGSFECQCNAGYNGDGAEGTCADIDECNDGTHTCDENATCTNNDGGFTCACNAGWNTGGNGQEGTCHNVNECSEAVNSHTCGANSKCVDNDGSYDCQCLPSFHMAEGECVDDDECANNSNDCHESRSACTNEAKTYTMESISDVAQYTMSRR